MIAFADLACGLLAALMPASPGSAAVPAPTPTTAVVSVKVAGARSSATTVAPVAGARFGLFATEPGQATFDSDGATSATPRYTCTSDAAGDCSFVVPIGAGGTTAGTRLWLAPIGFPTGWYNQPVWQTAPLSPTAADPKVQTPHVFQTPPLQANNAYVSGQTYGSYGFMTDPGSQTTPARPTAQFPNFTRRSASAGYWPLSRVNPDLPAKCGINVAIIVDLSSSVSGYVPQIQSAISSFVDGLRGTPSQAALFTFGTASPANGYGPNTSLMSVATTADANRFKQLYAGWGNPPTNYTNWDAGLEAASAVNQNPNPDEHFDLAVVLTDGNPTVYGSNRTNNNVPANSGYTRFREMEESVVSANRLKDEGTRVVAVGVGDGLDAGSAANLRSISGRTAYDSSAGNILDADYLQEPDYAAAGNNLRNLVLASCAPSISVAKRIVPPGDTNVDNAYTPGNPWTFDASTTTQGASVAPASGQTGQQTGALNFDVTLEPDHAPGDFTVSERPQTNAAGDPYTVFPTDGNGNHDPGGQNAVCVNKSEDDRNVPTTNTANGFTVAVGLQDAVSCVIYNQAPDTRASVVVHKRWRVTDGVSGQTTAYANGTQPPDLEARLNLDGPQGAPSSDQPWDVPRTGYLLATDNSVNVGENLAIGAPGCRFTGASMAGSGINGDQPLTVTGDSASRTSTVTAEHSAWTITNDVTCSSHLTLHKQVVGGTAQNTDWTLHATAGSIHHNGRDGDASITSVGVPADTPFTLHETPDSDPELLNYAQDRVGPLAPGASGSWDCHPTAAGVEGDTGANGRISVPLGTDVSCTAINRTAQLTISKHVVGGTAGPGAWTFHLTPVDPAVPGVPNRTLVGSATGTTTNVRPGQSYAVHETGAPDDYQLTHFLCTTDGSTSSSLAELVVPAGAHAHCRAVNTFSEWTVTKSSDPPSGSTVSPGSVITYTLTARELHGAPTKDVEITDDLARVLSHAHLIEGSIDPSAGHATRTGTELVWHIPHLSGTQTLTYRVRVHPHAHGVTLHNALTEHTTTEPGDPGDPSTPCADVPGGQDGCDVVDLPVVAPGSGGPGGPSGPGPAGGIPDTGGPSAWWLLGGAALVLAGGTTLLVERRRHHR